MMINCFHIFFRTVKKRGEGSYWVDVHSYGADELERWLGNERVRPVVVSDLIEVIL